MYYKDLDYCGYFDASKPYDYKFNKNRIKAVGWIDHISGGKISFKKGKPPISFLNKLDELVKTHDDIIDYMGWHNCVLCNIDLYGQFFLPYKDKIYVAPVGIVHYMREHNYSPPEEFINVVLEYDGELGGDDFLKRIRKIDDRFYWFLMWQKNHNKEYEKKLPWYKEFKKIREKELNDRKIEFEKNNKEYVEAKKRVSEMDKKQFAEALKNIW